MPESRARVRFGDCDPLGHLHHSRYLDLLLDARLDHLRRDYGLDPMARAETHGSTWVVASHRIAYLAPARPDEEVVVRSRLLAHSEVLLRVEMVMADARGRAKAILWTDFAHVAVATGKPVPHDAEVRALLASVVAPPATGEGADFEARVRELRGDSLARGRETKG